MNEESRREAEKRAYDILMSMYAEPYTICSRTLGSKDFFLIKDSPVFANFIRQIVTDSPDGETLDQLATRLAVTLNIKIENNHVKYKDVE